MHSFYMHLVTAKMRGKNGITHCLALLDCLCVFSERTILVSHFRIKNITQYNLKVAERSVTHIIIKQNVLPPSLLSWLSQSPVLQFEV